MKVLELKTRKIIDVNPLYGGRLIEQGKAMMPPIPPRMEKAPQPVKEPQPAKEPEAAKEPQKAQRKKG